MACRYERRPLRLPAGRRHVLSRPCAAPSLLALLALASFSAACQPTLQMVPGSPVEIKRGYCFANTAYVQARRERNPGDTLTKLSKYKEAQPHVTSGRIMTFSSGVSAVAGGTMLGLGISAAAFDSPEMSQSTSTALIATGAALAVLSVGLCIVGEGQYESAVEAYNARLLTEGAAPDTDDDEPEENADDKSPDVGSSNEGSRPSLRESSPP
jgi:hypothetical protein